MEDPIKIALRASTLQIVKAYEDGQTVDQIVDTLHAQLLANPNVRTTTRADQPDVTPGWFGMVGDAMPSGLYELDRVQFQMRGTGSIGEMQANLVQWARVKEWRMVPHIGGLLTTSNFLPHTDGDSIPCDNRARVDVKFFGSRTRYGVLADDVDWKNVTHYRVLQ